MGVQLEPVGPALEQYRTWRFGDARLPMGRAELKAALLQTATIPGLSDRLLELSQGDRADCHGPAGPESRVSVSRLPRVAFLGPLEPAPAHAQPGAGEVCWRLLPGTFDPSLVFAHHGPPDKTVITFPLPSPRPRACLKRRRPDTDVDGPNTSFLACKKRRLLRELVTSRLSQPFSLPATHILNREAVSTGDKRFVKLAAIMSARRLHSAASAQASGSPTPRQPSPSTWLRRAAVLNSLRARVCAAAAERASVPVPDLAAKAAVFRQSHGSAAFVGGRFLVNLAQPPRPSSPPGAPPSPPGSSLPAQGAAAGPSHGVHVPAAGPATATTRLRIPSPTLRPLRSPELRVTRPLVPLEDIEDLSSDDDSMAFPTSELESRYEDDPDDEDEGGGGVYADFSVIFGGGDGAAGEENEVGGSGCLYGASGGGEHVEDYMDDLDGIPWVAG